MSNGDSIDTARASASMSFTSSGLRESAYAWRVTVLSNGDGAA